MTVLPARSWKIRSVMVATLLASSAPAIAQTSADDAMRRIAEDVAMQRRDRSPQGRIEAGLRIEDFPDPTIESAERDAAEARAVLTRLKAVNKNQLSEDWRTTYELLEFTESQNAEQEKFFWLDFAIAFYRSSYAFSFFPEYMRSLPLESAADRQYYLHLLDEYGELIAAHRSKLTEQAKRGIRLPKAAIPDALSMIKTLREGRTANFTVQPSRLAALPVEVRDRFVRDVDQTVANRITPAFDGLLDVLGPAYQAAAPEAASVKQYPGGSDYYRFLIRQHTTVDMDPSAVHELGLRRVAELEGRLAQRAREAGATGDVRAFVQALQKSPEFTAETPADVEARYKRHLLAIEPLLPRYFSKMPQAPYGAARLPAAAEKGMTFGYYSRPTEGRPTGLYLFNGSDLGNRSLLNSRPLIYHELVPGHHLHLSLQFENKALPEVRRTYFSSAFTEGWAEYAASLGYEMGLYKDPKEDIGRTVMELLLASRLVVDTGISDKGWSLEKAQQYLREHTYQSDEEIRSESIRYATWPAQALAYRIGFETMWDLRHSAEKKLGAKFDLREFHNVILSGGTLPFPVLRERLDRYVSGKLGKTGSPADQ